MGSHGEDLRAWWLYGSVFQLDILWKWSRLENHPSVGFYYAKNIVVYCRHVSKKCEVIKQKSDSFFFFKKK